MLQYSMTIHWQIQSFYVVLGKMAKIRGRCPHLWGWRLPRLGNSGSVTAIIDMLLSYFKVIKFKGTEKIPREIDNSTTL